MKKAVFTFGRMNPPTVGHEKLVAKVKQVATRNRATPLVFLSHTQNKKKDPLSYQQKIYYAQRAFGKIVQKSDAKTIIQVLQDLEKKGYTDIVLVVGSDRVQDFKTLINQYNGKDYTFDSIDVVSAGERDPDAEGVEGMSASKMRAVAVDDDRPMFISGVPSKISAADATKLYKDVRKGMMLESFEDIDIDALIDEIDIDTIELDDLDEVLNLSQRLKKARQMKRMAPRFKNLRKIKAKRMADPQRLMMRARKQALNIVRKRVAGKKGQNYTSLSPAEKIAVDRLVQGKTPAIQKLAQRLLPKVRKAEMERLKRARGPKDEEFSVDEARKVAQDQDIAKRPGTQPAKYFKDLALSTKKARDAQFKKQAKMDDDDPSAYKPAPGDKSGETKPSKHTIKYKQMYGEEVQLEADDWKEILKTTFPSLYRAVDKTVNNKRYQYAIKLFLQYTKDNPKDRRRNMVKAAQATNTDVRTLYSVFMDLVDRGKLPKQLADFQPLARRDVRKPSTKPFTGIMAMGEGNGQEDEVSDLVPDMIRISMISGSKKKKKGLLLDAEFEKFNEQVYTSNVKQQHSSEKERLKQQHAREKERQKADHQRELDRAKIRDIRTESVQLQEGINDPAIFKAVFLAGGPGSGKSFIVGKTALPALGFKIVNSDDAFEAAMKKAGLEMDPESIFSVQGQEIRGKAKALTGRKKQRYIEGRLGLVIDGTGKDSAKIKRQAKMLKDLGYDIAMIFVNTDLDTALARNQQRARSLPDDEVKSMWKEVQRNMGAFQTQFGNNLVIVDNSEGASWPQETLRAYRKMSKFASDRPQNPKAIKWISQQKKESGLDEQFEMFEATSSIAPRDNYQLEEKAIEALKKKSEKSGISYSILKQVYNRGMAAWKTGHRPGTTPQQWAFARVNSFLTGGKTRTTADKDLWAKAGKSKKEDVRVGPYMSKAGMTESLDESFQMHIDRPSGYGQMVTARDAGINVRGGFEFHPSVNEVGGAGERGTNKLTIKYQKDTPGQPITAERCPRTNEAVCQCSKVNELAEQNGTVKAIVTLEHTQGDVEGNIMLTQKPGKPTVITGQITGLKPGKHGFHIHEFGDLSKGCESAGGHYNPSKVNHGDLDKGHVGDLGNIEANEQGIASFTINASRVTLVGEQSVVGRSIVVHSGEDDLGQGGDAESLKTGNAGSRLGCGVIRLAE
jgi:Cu/Zn superoxide dismutase/predicted kinase/nicotinic acid mononucleotide adenylyltransferase